MPQERDKIEPIENESKIGLFERCFGSIVKTYGTIFQTAGFRAAGPLRVRPRLIALLVLCSFTVASGVSAEENFKRLTGQQIRAKFVGMELTDESHWGDVFERDGTLRLYSMGHKSVGKWRIQKDQLCLDRGNEPGGGCFDVWISGKKVELRNQFPPLEGVLKKPTDR